MRRTVWIGDHPMLLGFGLTEEAAGALIMGFLRKDLAVGILVSLDLFFR